MDEYEREMETIALISNIDDNYTYTYTDKEVVDHQCNVLNKLRQIPLIEVEYFKDGQSLEDKACFCEHCKEVFIYKKDA